MAAPSDSALAYFTCFNLLFVGVGFNAFFNVFDAPVENFELPGV